MYSIKYTMNFIVDGSADLDAETDALADALFELESADENLFDAELSGNIFERQVTLSIGAKAGSFDAATSLANSVLRAAIHKVGGFTPTWDEVANDADSVSYDFVDQQAELV